MLDQTGSWEVRGDLACLLCGRSIATVQGPLDRAISTTTLKLRAAEHIDAVRRMRCPYCEGRLWIQDTEDIYVDRRPLTDDELHPRRGRPPKVARVS